MELRPYQKEAVQALRDNKKGIIAAATGSGKTTMMAASIKEKAVHGKVLVLVHLQDLVTQTTERLKSETGLKVAQFFGQVKDSFSESDVVVATWQSFQDLTISKAIPPEYFYSVNVDEAHHIRADKYRLVVDYFQPTFLHGFTATPFGKGQRKIFSAFGDIIFSIDLFDLIDMGFLTKMHMDVFLTNGKSLIDEKITEYNIRKNRIINELELKLREESRIPKIVHFFQNNKAIDRFNSSTKNIDAKTYTAKYSYKDKRKTLRMFKEETDSLNHLYSVRMLNEGIDIPIINGLVFHESAGDFRTFTQRLGRGLRVYKDPNSITYMCQFLDKEDENSVETITSLTKEIERSIQLRSKKERDCSDYVVINYDKGTKDFLASYKRQMEEIADNYKTFTCARCGQEIQVPLYHAKKLQSGDSFICTSCEKSLSVQTHCKKCKNEVVYDIHVYNGYISRDLNFYCREHRKTSKGCVLQKCSFCEKEYNIPYSRFMRAKEQNFKVNFCSMNCRTEYSKVTVQCYDCGLVFKIRKGDYNAANRRNQKIYCEKHKKVGKKKTA